MDRALSRGVDLWLNILGAARGVRHRGMKAESTVL